MPREIERKFLIKSNDYKLHAKGILYKQAYLCINDKSYVRIRTVGNKGYIAIKSRKPDISRLEFEYKIPLSEALELIDKLCEKPLISKHRYKVTYEKLLWEIDEFHGENKGLVIAEVELVSEDQNFEKPLWLGKEVTGDSRYYNINLFLNPFRSWKYQQ